MSGSRWAEGGPSRTGFGHQEKEPEPSGTAGKEARAEAKPTGAPLWARDTPAPSRQEIPRVDTAMTRDPLRQKAPPLCQVRSAPGRAGLTRLRPRRPRPAPGPRRHGRARPETAGSRRGLGVCARAPCFTPPGRPWGGPASPFSETQPGSPHNLLWQPLGGVPSSGLSRLFGLSSQLPGGCPGPLPTPTPHQHQQGLLLLFLRCYISWSDQTGSHSRAKAGKEGGKVSGE